MTVIRKTYHVGKGNVGFGSAIVVLNLIGGLQIESLRNLYNLGVRALFSPNINSETAEHISGAGILPVVCKEDCLRLDEYLLLKAVGSSASREEDTGTYVVDPVNGLCKIQASWMLKKGR